MKKTLAMFLLLMTTKYVIAQTSFSSGILPRVRISTKVSEKLKWVNGLETRQLFIDDTREETLKYEYVLTDISSLLSLKIGAYGAINGGYLLRFEGDYIFHRAIQQFTLVQNYDRIRLGHRFVTDQTFGRSESPEFRLRYRIALERPLSGNKVDPKELYFKISNEYLMKFQNSETTFETRILPFIGYEINKKNKVELGLDYRLDNLLSSGQENDLWLSINWYYTL
ncbi:DUF2490 domain-containing protein [Aquimarina sp. U1-2]|uniref:DUF2490 domain-containing protein n=1 Tax=Aquimarina sp. U1-2 TaxID=2823141 RepID=UPI001AECEE95|nr:DUF2490 domain-containing protein [Aquimarina sp. U1-2]MBP2832995.1 DUF2490 domain-containing protein [Aquimarina sp. U1-2]